MKKHLVLCNNVKFPGAIALPGAHFGVGTGPIFIKRALCSGSEDSILECQQSLDDDSCSHSNDASVICLGKIQCIY